MGTSVFISHSYKHHSTIAEFVTASLSNPNILLTCHSLLPTGTIPPLLNVSSTLQAAQTLVTSSIPDPSVDPSDAVRAGASNLYQAAENIAHALSTR